MTGATGAYCRRQDRRREKAACSADCISQAIYSQTFGMWQDPPALRDFTPSRNNLSTSRTLLQIDENYELSDTNNFFVRANGSSTNRRIRSTARITVQGPLPIIHTDRGARTARTIRATATS